MTYDELLTQVSWNPEIIGRRPMPRARVIVGGMGGSALPAHAVRFLDPAFPIATHRDYGVPEGTASDALYVAISYSGNTAETLSFAHEAHSRGFSVAAITSAGGELEKLARDKGMPYLIVPQGIQPRNALFYLLRSLLSFVGADALLADLQKVSFDALAAENAASMLAEKLTEAFPLFYASRRNGFLAYVTKINFNETGKMPAAANVFPELNHNEMQSYDTEAPEAVGALARFVLMHDAADDPRIKRRMEVFAELMRKRGRTVVDLPLARGSRAEQLASGWYIAHLAAQALALARGANPDAVPLVEEFKARL